MTDAYDFQRQAARRALGLPIEPPPAALMASLVGASTFKEWMHPRDLKGKWIEKWARVKLFLKGRGGKPEVGKVERLNRDGTVAVRVSEGLHAGSIISVHPHVIEASSAKAVLPELPTPPPSAIKVSEGWSPYTPNRPAFTGLAAGLVKGKKSWADIAHALRNRPIVTFDFETTGTDVSRGGHDRGVEVAAVRTVNGKVVDRFHAFMNPGAGRHIHPQASAITGITDAQIAHEADHTVVAQQLKDFIGNDIVAGHNVGFDIDALTTSLRDAGVTWQPAGAIDTLAIARDTMPSQRKNPNGVVKDHKLKTLAEFFNIKLEKAHAADADTEATAHLLGQVLAYAARHGASPGDMDELKRRWDEDMKGYRMLLDAWRHRRDNLPR